MEQGNALPAGTRLGGYEIESVLGRGGFGITYRAYDLSLNKVVAIKEYLPGEFAMRTTDSRVGPTSEADRADYEWGLARFMDEARTLARFDHPHVNRVHRFFEANGTAYLVLEYVEGEVLSARLRQAGPLTEGEVTRLLADVLSGLEEVHEAGYVHRDLKPGNLIVRPDGRMVILDFGAARQAVGQRSKSITSILTPGYAPIEQYDTKAEDVGPWSDIYALGMVAYRCISGLGDGDLPDAVTRSRHLRKGVADLTPAATLGKGRYDGRLLEGVDWAIRVNEDERPQSIAVWRTELPPLEERATVLSSPPPAAAKPIPGKTNTKKLSRWMTLAGVIVLVIAVGGGAYWLGQRTPSQPVDPSGPAVVEQGPVEPPDKVREAEQEPREAERRRAAEAARQRTQPGATFRDCPTCPQLVVVPAGSYRMGSPSYEHEGPVHRVTIGQPLAVGVYEVTVGEYRRFVEATGYAGGERCLTYEGGEFAVRSGRSWRNPGYEQSTREPVVCVNWRDARAYVEWLSEQTGESYRLPSEAEWEYVARAGTTTARYWGEREDEQCRYANGADSQTNFNQRIACNDGYTQTAPVGSYEVNAFGLYDVLGNVREWVQDCENRTYVGAPSDGRAWERGYCSHRGLRGGSWFDRPWNLRSANRDWYTAAYRDHDIGFRIARSLP